MWTESERTKMGNRRVSVKRIGLILTFGIAIGGLTLFVAKHGNLWNALASASDMVQELQIEVRATIPFTETARRLREYRANHNKWEALGLTTYDYEFEAHCFCSNGGRHIVRIRDAQVAEVMDSETAELVHAGDLRLYDTIDQRFEIVRNAIRYGADRFQVSFDPDTGIPVRTEYDYRTEVMDDEGWNTIRLLPSASHGDDAT